MLGNVDNLLAVLSGQRLAVSRRLIVNSVCVCSSAERVMTNAATRGLNSLVVGSLRDVSKEAWSLG